MDKKPYIKMLKFLDEYFSEANYMNDTDEFWDLFEATIFADDFLDLDEFIQFNTESLNYKKYVSLEEQYGDISENLRLKIIEIIYNIVFYSKMDNKIKTKMAAFLARFKIVFLESDGYRKITSGDKFDVFEGSFGKVYALNPEFVKKQLKPEYWGDDDISSRFKNEFIIQNRMKVLGAKVLDVFDYDEINHSFLMQRADTDLYDYLNKNKINLECKVKLCKEILYTMEIAHNNSIWHRDLHIGNILLMNGHALVTDFGFAKDENHLRSRLSTVTPKPTHMYLAPEGFKDFTQLDNVSDIFSIGKIIDYIMGDGYLGKNHSFKLIVEKATKASRGDRYQNITELKEAFELIYNNILKGENIEQINKDIDNGVYTTLVEEYLLKLVDRGKLASQIISNSWGEISNIICKCDISNQIKIVESIEDNYIEATGYGGWGNYDIFANLSYDIIKISDNLNVKKVAYSILEHCATVRFSAEKLLNSIPDKDVQILK